MKLPSPHSGESVRSLFQRLPRVALDEEITPGFLGSIGFSDVRQATELISILKVLDFVSHDNFPTSNWHKYVEGQKKEVLRAVIKKCYADLFRIYPEPYRQASATIKNWAQAKYQFSSSTAERIERCFRILCSMANFKKAELSVSNGAEPSELKRKEGEIGNFTITLPLAALSDITLLESLKKYGSSY